MCGVDCCVCDEVDVEVFVMMNFVVLSVVVVVNIVIVCVVI